jgi:hypothetical protein
MNEASSFRHTLSRMESEPFRWRSTEAARAAAICLALSVVFLSPIFSHFSNWGSQDWDQHAFYHEAARVSLLQYGQLPQWNPYYCGGADLLANPQSRVLGPTFPIVLLFGSVFGLKIEMVLFAFVGMLGLYGLGRYLGLDALCVWVVPMAYFLGPLYALPISSGMTWFMSTAYIPWAVHAFLRGFRAPRALLGGGVCLALMYLGGGVYPLVVTVTFFAFYTLLGLPEHGVKRSARVLGMLVAVMLGLGAAKFFPSVALMRELPRHTDEDSGFSVESLMFGLFHRDQRFEVGRTHFDASHIDEPNMDAPGRFLRGISSDFDDVGMYIGPVVAALFLVGLAVKGRSLWRLGVTLPVFLWLSLGLRSSPSLFGALHRLPVYDSMRYAERFRVIWLLVLCLFAGFGLQSVRGLLDRRYPRRLYGVAVISAILAFVACDLFVVSRPIYRSAFRIPPIETISFSSFRQVWHLQNYNEHGFTPNEDWETYGSWSALYPGLLMNLGAVDCYESAYVPRRRATPMSSPDYRGEVYLEGGAGTVTTAYWSPNRLRYALDVREPAVLVVNQNYYPSWRAHDGRRVTSHNGLLSVEVGPDDRFVELRYRRVSFSVGLLVSAMSWIALIAAAIYSTISTREPGTTSRRLPSSKRTQHLVPPS